MRIASRFKTIYAESQAFARRMIRRGVTEDIWGNEPA
jgi:hypothetical protein